MFVKSSYLIVVLSLFTYIPVLHAGENGTLFNQVRLEARAEREVENDQLRVVLAVEAQGAEPDKLADRVNETMRWALDMAGKQPDIQISTKAYQTFPVYKDKLVVAWRASQLLEIESTNIPVLSKLTGMLQAKLQIREMTFTPTEETRVKAENTLIGEAMEAFKRRVEVIGKHMKEKNYRIVEININTGGYQPPVMLARSASLKAMSGDIATPAVEAGTSKVTVTVSGSVQFF